MIALFYIGLYVVQIIKFACVYDLFFSREKRSGILTLVLMLTGCIALYVVTGVNICNPVIPYTFFMIYETVVLYKTVDMKIILIGIWLTCIIGMLDELSHIITSRLLTIFQYNNMLLCDGISNFITLTFLVVLSFLIRKRTSVKIEKISVSYFIFSLIATVVNTLLIIYLNYFVFKQTDVGNKILVYICFFGTAVGMFVEMAMIMLLAVSRTAYKERDELNRKYLEQQREHYKYLEEREQKTKEFRHDIRSHMALIRHMIEQHSYDEVEKYIDDVCGRIDELGCAISVNNGIVDAILNKFCADAERENVQMKVSGHFPTECNIDAFDLCTIFSNLLANAVEAAAKSSGKSIEVKCGYNENYIMVEIVNDYTGKIKVKGDSFITSKKGGELHGFGLSNVRKCVKENNGYIEIKCEEKFRAKVSLVNDRYGEPKNENSNSRR